MGLKIVGPDVEEYLEIFKEVVKGQYVEPRRYYFKDDPNRDERSVRGCFLDSIYSRENLEAKLADKFFDGDVPFMYDNLDDLPEASYEEFLENYLVDAGPRADRKYKIVFYGVSGYTGSLIMEYLKRESLDNVEIAFSGRTLSKVIAMRDKVLGDTRWANADCFAADLSNPFDVEKLVSQTCVVANIAGPFMLTGGERIVEACIHYDTDYCDVSGEIPWSAKLLEFHDLAREAGVYIVPSAAFAGGVPDLGCYLIQRKIREMYGEETRKVRGYVEMYQEKAGIVSASGGTLSTRAAMSQGDAWVRKQMQNVFSLGGSVHGGTREEDRDMVLTKVFLDPLINKWVCPHQYAFFETRVVRRSNWLHNQLVGGPDKGYWYGSSFNFTASMVVPNEKAAKEIKKGAASVKAEEERLRAMGKYYGAGEGPPVDELFDIGVYMTYHFLGLSESGKKVGLSFKGRDGYYETARVCVETAMTLALDSKKLRTGKEHVRGGVLGAGIAGREPLLERLRASGLGYIDWTESGKLPDNRAYETWGMKPYEAAVEENE